MYGKIKHQNIWNILCSKLDCLNVNVDECVFIDNQEKNLIIPKSIGMNTIYFNHDERNYKKLIKELKELSINIV